MEQQSLLPSHDEAPGPSRAKLALASALATGCLIALATTVDPSGARPESALAATGGEAEEGPSGGIGVSGPNDDYVLDIYGKGLECDKVDDDVWEWGDPYCVSGDTYTCSEYALPDKNQYIWSACNQTCDAAAIERMRKDVEVTGDYHWDSFDNYSSWWVVCEWEAITKLPELCDRTFTPTTGLLNSSRNEGGEYTDDANNQKATDLALTGGSWDSCNAHAFCRVGLDSRGSLNKYIRAALEHYSTSTSPGEAKASLFTAIDDWCEEGVLEAIEDGTFDPSADITSYAR